MNCVSEFTINEKYYPATQPNSSTPQASHSSHDREKQIEVPTTLSTFQSNYKCTQCPDHLSSLTQAKKHQILLEYQLEILKQQIQRLKRENQHLAQFHHTYHKANLEKYNPIMYFKQDLESQLYQAKYLLELHILSKSNDQNQIKPSIIKESQKEKNCIEQISKPVDLKRKCEDLLLENIKLQQKNMIKDKIIEERCLFPLYHYDQRILTLRKAVEFWYRKAEQQTSKLAEVMVEVKKIQKELKKQTKLMVEQERVFWEAEIRKVIHELTQLKSSNQCEDGYKSTNGEMSSCYDSSKSVQNQDNQNRHGLKIKQNILIEDDHTILSICQKIKQTKKIEKPKETKRKSVAAINENLCESCILDEKKKSKHNLKGNKSVNKSGKDSAKDQLKQQTSKQDCRIQEQRKKTLRKENQSQAINSSMMWKNFENIEIKLKRKDKSDDNYHGKKGTTNSSPKMPQKHISCQRCAQRML